MLRFSNFFPFLIRMPVSSFRDLPLLRNYLRHILEIPSYFQKIDLISVYHRQKCLLKMKTTGKEFREYFLTSYVVGAWGQCRDATHCQSYWCPCRRGCWGKHRSQLNLRILPNSGRHPNIRTGWQPGRGRGWFGGRTTFTFVFPFRWSKMTKNR